MSHSPEIPQNPEYLDPHEAAKWLPYTFYFSQGSPALQKAIFDYIKLDREETIPESIMPEIKKLAAKEIKEILLSEVHTKTKPSQLNLGLNEEISDLQDSFKSNSIGEIYPSREVLLDQLLFGIIDRDRDYLLDKKERPSLGPLGDKYLSHVVHYIIHAGKVTNGNSKFEFHNLPPIFKGILSELRKYLKSLLRLTPQKLTRRQKRMLDDLKDVLNAYNAHHPATPASLDDLLKE